MTAIEAPTASLREVAELSHAWPFEEARKMVERLDAKAQRRSDLLETGYGPSGLPHIGTFGEVARTSLVRHAFRVLTSNIPTRLIAFSDDMDGLRKVPDNLPSPRLIAAISASRSPASPTRSALMPASPRTTNARLQRIPRSFRLRLRIHVLDRLLHVGRFDDALLKVLHHFEQVMEVMLPSLREERAQTYSPFLPIDPESGIVLQVPVVEHDAKAGTITYEHPDRGGRVTTLRHRRPLQAAMEAGLGDALGGARRRLRNGR